ALHDVLSNVQYQFAPRLTQHRLLAELPARALIVHADPERLTQVLMNLVSNAIKYSPSGGDIHISARVEGERLVVSVRDQGLGLPAGAMARLFEQFYRVEEHRQHGIEGTGLGLAICRQIVEEMGGRIWAESPGLGHGSTFSFTVPLAAISG
ncbi:MAG: hypothetical protein HY691_17345, partial [Chloroflexi bacterium]|nr:hypothetical protein [Chloroflexota bacterium]